MNKIIAREFLILIGGIVLGFLIFLGIIPYNAYQQGKINERTELIIQTWVIVDSIRPDGYWIRSRGNSLTPEDVIMYKKSEKIINDVIFPADRVRVDARNKILYEEDRKNFAKKLAITLAALIFALRYFIYTIIWSVKTLRN